MSEEFPETLVEGVTLNKFKKIAFTMAHNKYYPTQPASQNLELIALVLNKEGEIVTEINP